MVINKRNINQYFVIFFSQFLVLLIIFASWRITLPNEEDENYIYENSSFQFQWLIIGNISNQGNFSIIVPTPLNRDKEPMYSLLDNLTVENGNVTFRYLETDYGIGLEINSSASFTMSAIAPIYMPSFENNSQLFGYFDLSVENITKKPISPGGGGYYDSHQFWTYGNFSDNNSYLNLRMICTDIETPDHTDFGRIWNQHIENIAWQKINGSYNILLST